MRIAFISILLMSALASCKRKDDSVNHESLPSIYRCSAFAARAETGACYEILVSGNPRKIKWAIYGDGKQEIEESNSIGEYEVRDHQNGEVWKLKLDHEGQYLIHSDRSVERVDDFARVGDNGMEFSQTDEPILQRVAETFRQRHKSEKVVGSNG